MSYFRDEVKRLSAVVETHQKLADNRQQKADTLQAIVDSAQRELDVLLAAGDPNITYVWETTRRW